MARQNGSSFISEDLEVANDNQKVLKHTYYRYDCKGYARTAGEDGFSGPFGREKVHFILVIRWNTT